MISIYLAFVTNGTSSQYDTYYCPQMCKIMLEAKHQLLKIDLDLDLNIDLDQ